SGKTYTSNIVTVRTLSDPYSYDRNEIGINLSELEKNSAILVSSIENTVELSKTTQILIVDFYSDESINSKGREVANSLTTAFRNSNKCTIVSLPSNDKETMKKSGGIKDYKQACSYGKQFSANYVCYGTIEKISQEKKYKVNLKMIDVKEENIVTVKEMYVSSK
ncbi:MAG: hypothetical protein IJ727_09305, partial [Treponema sp.]|nr:hypothetical protein [Treponema sp.]